jgi:hypothetical protein
VCRIGHDAFAHVASLASGPSTIRRDALTIAAISIAAILIAAFPTAAIATAAEEITPRRLGSLFTLSKTVPPQDVLPLLVL